MRLISMIQARLTQGRARCMVSPGTESPPPGWTAVGASLARTGATRNAGNRSGPCLGLGATAARRDGADRAAAGLSRVRRRGPCRMDFLRGCSRAARAGSPAQERQPAIRWRRSVGPGGEAGRWALGCKFYDLPAGARPTFAEGFAATVIGSTRNPSTRSTRDP